MERREFLKKSALAALGTAVAGTGIVQAFNLVNDNESKTEKMKIVVLTGSPRKNGNSAYLAEQFIKGAEEKGHDVFRFDCAFKQVEPCRACNRCGMDGPCIFNDDFQELRPHLIEADMVVFATPMYYFSISAQQIKGASKKAAFLMTYADTAKKEAEPMLVHYHTLMDYLGWTSVSEVVASGVWTAGSVRNTDYPQQAYQLGRSL